MLLPSTEGTEFFTSPPAHAFVEPDDSEHDNEDDGGNYYIRHTLSPPMTS
jgi:hypothetical protein